MSDQIRVLLVDDQPHFADLAKTFLERKEDRITVDTVTSAAAGLSALEETDYDCIVSDFEMPQTNGVEFFERTRERDIELPFILFSAKNEREIKRKAELGGVTAYLQKGGEEVFADLAKRIKITVREHDSGRDLLDVQERYDTLFEQTSFAMAWVDCNGSGPILTDFNDRFEAEFLNGTQAPSEVPLDTVLKDASIDGSTIEEVIEAGQPTTVESEHHNEEDICQLRWQVIPVDEDEGSATAHGLLTAVNVSEEIIGQHELERFKSIVEASGDPMYVLDMGGNFTYVNDALIELSGYSRKELLGKSGRFVMNDEDYQQGTELIKELLRSDRDNGMFEMDLVTATGEDIPCENHISLIYDVETGDGDEVKGTAGVIRDISERKERIMELRRHNERLEELAAFISHDLQNPLNVASGHLELLEDHKDNRHIEAIDQAVDRMEELVEDLLAMARSGQTLIDPEPVRLDEAALLSWSNLSTKQANLEIEMELEVIGDESRIRQLFENLFLNAVEHGDGPVSITVGDLNDGFFVEDNGPGIDPNIRDSVFDHGYTTDKEGTGFGLSIVKAVADAHDWKVDITEAPDGGARFEFTEIERNQSNRNVYRQWR